MRARWLFGVLLGVGCGGGGETTPGDLGQNPAEGVVLDGGADSGVTCQVKEDCPALPCHLAVCLSGVCDYQVVPAGAACSDKNACVLSGVCDERGTCQGEWSCDDLNPCTTDECIAGQCTHETIESGPCDDGDPCTQGDACVQGVCVSGQNTCDCREDKDCPMPTDLCLGRLICDPEQKMCVPDPEARVVCDESERPCYKNSCDPNTGQCKEVTLQDGSPCDLGKCVVDEACRGGECVGTPKCVSMDPCKVATCDEASGNCGTKDAPDGTKCDDKNPCTPNDRCSAGKCIADPPPPESCNGKDDDCDGKTDPEGSKGCKNYYWDGDKDGAGNPTKFKCLCEAAGQYTAPAGDDCDDANANVHPAVAEACNGRDDNCDGLTDEEGAVGCVQHYKDQDGDGFGVATDWKCLCGVFGYYKTTTPGDCDDTNAQVRPGAAEICNQIDDNCDGSTDEGEDNSGCVKWYLDNDGDGFGSTTSKCLCKPFGAYSSSNSLDCDDTRKGVYPGATEVCNTLDDDCDGTKDQGENLSGCKNFYLDNDGDGFGTASSKCLCQAAGLYRADKTGDCNDADAAVYPGGKVCGKDGDCDGKLPDIGEPCDDGNTTTWDGCNEQCQVVEFQVNSYYVNDQRMPDAAFPGTVGNSGYFIAWHGVGCVQFFGIPPTCMQTEDGVWVRRYDGGGQSLRLELANTYQTGFQRNPAVAASANGAVVVWDGQGSDTELSEIYVRRFNPDGTPKENFVTRVNAITSGTQSLPDVVADYNLAFRVVWQSQISATDTDVILRAFTSTLTPWSENTVNLTTSGHQAKPRIAAFDGGGRFVVVWESYSQAGQEDVYARRFLWNTTALDTSDSRVNAHISGSQREPSVAGNPSSGGGFVVAWTGTGPGGVGDDIWARVFHSDGTPVSGSEVRVNDRTAGNQSQPDVAMAADGSFWVAWYNGADVSLKRFRSDQTPLTAEITVNLYEYGVQANPALTGASDGLVLVTWESDYQDGSEYGVFAQRFGPNGVRLYR